MNLNLKKLLMLSEEMITGTLVNSYMVCKRKAWLHARNISPTSSNSYIQMGAALGRIKGGERRFGNIEVDEITKDGHILLREYKKTFSNLLASEAQILFYMKTIKKDTGCMKISGHIISLENNQKKWIDFNRANEKYINEIIKNILILCSKGVPPPVLNNEVCVCCGHNTYCI
jgi:CRISPR-associated exonuclease Cas4